MKRSCVCVCVYVCVCVCACVLAIVPSVRVKDEHLANCLADGVKDKERIQIK